MKTFCIKLFGILTASGLIAVAGESDQNAIQETKATVEKEAAEAQFNLGWIYFNGHDVIKGPVYAHAWFTVAGANGDEKAPIVRKIIETKITLEQKAEATKLARELSEKINQAKPPAQPDK